MSWFDTVGQNYAPQRNSAKDDNWDTVTKALSIVNPTLGAVSSVGQMLSGYYGGKEQRKAQKQAVQQQQEFQERMANTAYKRSMSDMRSAGLNPILAGKLGGASTPTGATYKPENKMLQWAQITSAVSSAQKLQNEVKMQNMDIDMMKRRGLSPMAFKHTPFNQLGSEWLKKDHPIGQFLRGELLTNVMNSHSAKTMKQKIDKILNRVQVRIRNVGGRLVDEFGRFYD